MELFMLMGVLTSFFSVILGTLFLREDWSIVKHDGILEWARYYLVGALFASLISVVLWLALLTVGAFTNFESTKVVSETPIVSLDRGKTLEGSFVLGTGSIDSHISYYYYLEVGEGEYEMDKISTRNTRVIIAEGHDDPMIVEYKTYHENKWVDILFGLSASETFFRILVPNDAIEKTISP